MPCRRSVQTIARVVLDLLIRDKLDRVKDASALREYKTRKGVSRVCRVCLLGAAIEAHGQELINAEEHEKIFKEIVRRLEAHNDFASELNTVPDTRAMHKFFLAIADRKPWKPGAKK